MTKTIEDFFTYEMLDQMVKSVSTEEEMLEALNSHIRPLVEKVEGINKSWAAHDCFGRLKELEAAICGERLRREEIAHDRNAWKMEAEDSRAVLRHHVEERDKAREDAARLAEALMLLLPSQDMDISTAHVNRWDEAKEALALHDKLKGGA